MRAPCLGRGIYSTALTQGSLVEQEVTPVTLSFAAAWDAVKMEGTCVNSFASHRAFRAVAIAAKDHGSKIFEKPEKRK